MINVVKTTKEYRKFGVALTLAFVLFGSLMLWRGHPLPMKIFYTLSAVTLLFTITRPETMKYPILMFLGIGWFNTKLILILTFFLVITPVGLVMRLIGKDPLDKKWNVEKQTYWLDREDAEYSPNHIERPF